MNSSDAYESLIQPHSPQMLRSVWRIAQNADDADESMQLAATKILENLDQIRTHANPRALLLRICIHAACDVKRQRAKLATMGEAVDSVAAAPVPSRVEDLETRDMLVRAITALPTQQATAVTLRFLLDENYTNIAAALECSESTARVHVARGLDKLRHSLSSQNPSTFSEPTQ